ncbi:amino acid permease [Myxococcota bacterium]|nr:amino acid permease [Myxococcota bacterium]MBU1430079.1 amino acid permease [Myxococcota bacterium]MBU1900667.1 amino acid permease [Myxococcota bacterium]
MNSKPHQISALGALAIVTGSMLGVGIFLSPVSMAAALRDPLAFFIIWLLVAVMVLGGAVAYAQLGMRYPLAGGDYVYHREAFGQSVAFATGWALFGAIFTGSIAAIAVAIFDYQISGLTGWALSAPLLGPITGSQLGGAALILALTGLNAVGIRPTEKAQSVAALLPLGLLFLIALYAIFAHAGALPARLSEGGGLSQPRVGAWTAAFLAAYFAYSGWNAVTYVAGEVAEPRRTLPRALIGGTLLITALYLTLCLAFVLVLGIDGIAEAGEAGTAMVSALWGPSRGAMMNLLILMGLLASLNSSVMGGARVVYAMAQDGAFWRRAGRLHPRTGLPRFALWVQAAWAIALILTNRFEALLLAVSLTMIATGALTVIAYFSLRRREALGGRPYLPAFYLIASVGIISVEFSRSWSGGWGDAVPLFGLALALIASVAHALWRRGLPAAQRR